MLKGMSSASNSRQVFSVREPKVQASTPVWYAYHTGVLACTFGSRTEKTCRELLALLMPFNIGTVITDD